jgi:hypothetical protein
MLAIAWQELNSHPVVELFLSPSTCPTTTAPPETESVQETNDIEPDQLTFHQDVSTNAVFSDTALPFRSNLFTGRLLFTTKHHSQNSRVYRDAFSSAIDDSSHITSELRVEGKFNRKLRGKLFLAAELDIPAMSWSPQTTFLSHCLLQLISKVSPNLSWSTGDPKNGIKPHIAFPLIPVVDDLAIESKSRFSVYDKIQERDADRQLRQRTNAWQDIESSVDAQTTMAFRARFAFIDWAKWCACDIPFIHKIPLKTWWGDNPVNLCVYEKTSDGTRSDVVTLRIGNKEHTN